MAYGDFSATSAEHAVYRLLDRRPDTDAVFASSDLMALIGSAESPLRQTILGTTLIVRAST
jgi:DNA-binding LacI/PurR family transcriptional regulator